MKQAQYHRLVFPILVGCAATLLGGNARPAAASSAPSQEMNFTLEGKISKHSPGKLTVSGEGNIIFHVAYNDKTEIKQKDGSAATAKDLRVGVTIRVEGDLTESGEIVAQKITILPEPSGQKP